MKGELDRFLEFARGLCYSWDVDPFFPVLKEIAVRKRLTQAQGVWFTGLFTGYAQTPSTVAALRRWPWPCHPDREEAKQLPTDVGRRGLRGGRVAVYLAGLADHFGNDPLAWITEGWGQSPYQNYETFWKRALSVWGVGRWSAFKWSELLKRVNGLPLAAPDMRLAFGGKSVQAGLRRTAGLADDAPLEELEMAARWLFPHAERVGAADWELLETCLCKYHSHRDGRYYVGLDVDEMQMCVYQALQGGWLGAKDAALIFEARATTVPYEYLGEANGWMGLRPKRYAEGL